MTLYPCGRRTCPHCAGRKNRVLGRMLLLDAAYEPPTHVMTLTTSDPFTTSGRFRRGVQSVTQRLRRSFASYEYFLKVEFTTGLAATSGGHRRIHGHLCCKGLAGEDVRLLEGLVRETWEAVTGAVVVEVAEMITPAGALHYLGLHHGKPSQAPPPDWRGMVERFSRGYLYDRVSVVREEAKRQLSAEGLAWSTGLSYGDARFMVDTRREEAIAYAAAAASLRAEMCTLAPFGSVEGASTEQAGTARAIDPSAEGVVLDPDGRLVHSPNVSQGYRITDTPGAYRLDV